MKFPNISYSALALMKVRKLQLVEQHWDESSGVRVWDCYQRFIER